MTKKIQEGSNRHSANSAGTAHFYLLKKGSCSTANTSQRNGWKTTKKAPEGAFESALYPGLKDST